MDRRRFLTTTFFGLFGVEKGIRDLLEKPERSIDLDKISSFLEGLDCEFNLELHVDECEEHDFVESSLGPNEALYCPSPNHPGAYELLAKSGTVEVPELIEFCEKYDTCDGVCSGGICVKRVNGYSSLMIPKNSTAWELLIDGKYHELFQSWDNEGERHLWIDGECFDCYGERI